MASPFDIGILFSVIKDITTFLKGQSEKKRDNVIKAHEAIHTAFMQTYDYLRNKNGAYVSNIELAEVWNHASALVLKVDTIFGEMLYHKSRFWLDPELYINLNRDSEIINLNQIIDEMERLRMKL